jgi:hypothetical protein
VGKTEVIIQSSEPLFLMGVLSLGVIYLVDLVKVICAEMIWLDVFCEV